MESSKKILLAVDGGGSKTLCWIASFDPNEAQDAFEFDIIGRGHAGPSNPRSVGFDQAFANMESAMRMALQESDLHRSSISVACLSLAGAGRVEEQARIDRWVNQNHIAHQTIVVDDIAPIRFAAAYEHRVNQSTGSSPPTHAWDRSISLVAGTGSIAFGCDENSITARSGGWGYLLGDEGSGYAIGLSGIRSICETHDHGLKLSEFQNTLLQRIKLDDPTQLIGWIYQVPVPRQQIADLAEIVLSFVAKDPIALKIVNDALFAMVNEVRVVAKRLGFLERDYSLALSGGILKAHPFLVERLLDELTNQSLTPRMSHLVVDPLLGVLMMAANRRPEQAAS